MDLRFRFLTLPAAMTTFVRRSIAFYNKQYSTKNVSAPPYELKIVLIDDFGSFWNPDKADETLNAVEDASS